MVGKGKKKRSREAEDDDEEVVMVDKSTSLYVKCRDFIGLTREQLKEFVEKQGFTVKAINKPNKKEFGFIDIGSADKLDELCEKLKGQKFKGSIIVADRVKDNKEVQKNKETKPTQTIAILDRLLCVRGLTKFVSKRTLTDVFKKAESVIIPSSKGNLLRDALVVFNSPEQVTKSIKEYQGWELGGEKLRLERLVSIPIADQVNLTIDELNTNNTNNNVDVKVGGKKNNKIEDVDDDGGEDVEADGGGGKSNKSLKNARQKNKQKKNAKTMKNKEKEEDDEDEDEEEREAIGPPKKKTKN